jgi:hypothetical protein
MHYETIYHPAAVTRRFVVISSALLFAIVFAGWLFGAVDGWRPGGCRINAAALGSGTTMTLTLQGRITCGRRFRTVGA